MSGYNYSHSGKTYASTAQIKTVARGVESIRMKRDLTVKEVCAELGWSETVYRNMLAGKCLTEKSIRELRAWMTKHS